jgi:hypothetical protein
MSAVNEIKAKLGIFVEAAQAFLDWAGLSAPLLDAETSVLDLGECEDSELSAAMAWDLAICVERTLFGVGELAEGLDVFAGDPLLRAILPGYLGFRLVFRQVAGRWGFKPEVQSTPDGRSVLRLIPPPDRPVGPLPVTRAEFAAMERSVAILKRIKRDGYLQIVGQGLYVITPRGTLRAERPARERLAVHLDADKPTICLDGVNYLVNERVAIFVKTILDASPGGIKTTELIESHPTLAGANITRLEKEIPEPIRDLLLRPGGWRLRD